MSPSAVASLRLELSLVRPVLWAATARMWRADSGLPGRYRRYLCAMHQMIRASVPLMERAATRCEALPRDPVARPSRGTCGRTPRRNEATTTGCSPTPRPPGRRRRS